MTNKYRDYFESGVCEERSEALISDALSPENLIPDDIYWLGKCLSECTNPKCWSLSISCLSKGLEQGLNYSFDNENNLEIYLLISRQYIKLGDYISAMNHLKILTDSISSVPDSVNIYFLISQIMSDQVFYIVRNPKFFFSRLDKISPENQDNRAKVYSIFLKRLTDLEHEHKEYNLNISKFRDFKDKYGSNLVLSESNDSVYSELDVLYAGTESFGFSRKNIVDKKKNQRNVFDNDKISIINRENDEKISAFADISSDLKNRETIINDLFDKKETNVRKTLISHYPYGFNLKSNIELKRFCSFYELDFGIEYSGDKNHLNSDIQNSGIIFDGNVYCVSLETIKKIDLEISKSQSLGVSVIYYEKFYSLNKKWLFDEHIISIEMLRFILEQIYQNFVFNISYFTFTNVKKFEKEIISEEIIRVWGYNQIRNEDELSNLLPYIPLDKIKSSLSFNDIYIWNSPYTYTRRDLFKISREEIEILRKSAFTLCKINTYATFEELPIENIIAENFELSQHSIYDILYSYLSDSFDRNKSTITFKGDNHSTKKLIVDFCRNCESCTISDLKGVLVESRGNLETSDLPTMLETANSVLVRINEDYFVSDAMVYFDVDGIDDALDMIIPNGLCGIREIRSFSLFPSCGFEWNIVILESYCRRFSGRYSYVTPRAGTLNIGAIVKKGSTKDYHKIMVNAVAQTSIGLNEEAVFDFLINSGFISRRRYENMDDLLEEAKKLRNNFQ